MFLQRLLMSAIGVAAIGIMSLPVAHAAQWPHHGWHHDGEHWGPMYDVRTETRVTGNVEAVRNVAGCDDGYRCAAGGGTHVTLKTATQSIDVHLGPTVWLRQQGINLAAGDQVEILGSRVTMRGAPVLLARELKKGETTWTLRTGPDPRARSHCR